MRQQKLTPVKVWLMLIGILLIGMCVASYRLSGFGVDAFTCMNLGISGFLHMTFGTWQLIMNAIILVVVFFTVKFCIGPGTLVNMVCVGYIADFLCWLARDVACLTLNLPLRIVFLCLGTLFASLGCAFYMTAELGIAPYDSIAFIITKLTGQKVSFRMARVLSDITAILVGVSFCLVAHNSLWDVIGLGTVINALCNGPLIQLFRGRIERIS